MTNHWLIERLNIELDFVTENVQWLRSDRMIDDGSRCVLNAGLFELVSAIHSTSQELLIDRRSAIEETGSSRDSVSIILTVFNYN